VVGASLNSFSESLPFYETRIREQTAALFTWLRATGVELPDTMPNYFDPGGIMRLVGKMIASLSGVLANAFLILLTVIFILMEATVLPAKLRIAFSKPDESMGQANKFLESFNRYMAIKTFTSLLTGAFIAVWLSVQGVDFALLWGLLAFVLNYVPNIGSLIAAVPGVLITLIQLGVGSALVAAVGYFVVNTIMGSILEPRLMGHGLGLSTLIVFLSLVFWGWVLGPVGMLLSVPLTVALKIALEVNESTRPIAILLGPGPEARAVIGKGSKSSSKQDVSKG
jgi:predicted PurR-regulated permease PerM